MARVRVCSACDHPNPPGELECDKCRVSIVDVLPTEDAEAGKRDVGVGSESNRLPDGTTREPARARLELPWGAEEVSDLLHIGRDSKFSPLADRLADNQYVSDQHAEVFLQDGLLYVRDIGTHGSGSTNGTFVNGNRIIPLKPLMLADGDKVEFSHHLTAIVRLG